MRRENQNPGLGSPRLARRHQRRTNERAANESVFVFVFVFQKPKTKNQKREKKRRKSSDTGNHGAAITLINALNESQQIRWPAADKINLGAPRLNSAITATHTHTHTKKPIGFPFSFLIPQNVDGRVSTNEKKNTKQISRPFTLATETRSRRGLI